MLVLSWSRVYGMFLYSLFEITAIEKASGNVTADSSS
jgi:hypothetical protein